MKRKRIFALVICVGWMIFASNAQASTVSVSPSVGSLQGLPGSTITFDVRFNPDQDFAFDTWNLRLQFDSAELTNPISYNPFGASAITGDPNPTPNPEIFIISQIWGPQANFTGGNTYLLAQFDFTIGSPVLDGSPDFSVMENQFQLFFSSSDPITFATLVNSDVGAPAPVPVPAAVWLLGSGLVGLLGIRRKMKA